MRSKLKPKLVVLTDIGVIFNKRLDPGEYRLHLDELLRLKNEKVQAQTQYDEKKAANKAVELINSLATLPTHRKIACLTRNVLLPLLKPLQDIISV